MPGVNAKERSAPARETRTRPSVERIASGEALPLYEAVKRHMSESILAGEWPPGTVLPGEVALGGMYGVAVGTVRRAMADLAAEGLLTRRRKTGTVVTGRAPHHSLRFFFQFFRLHAADGAQVRSQARMLSRTVGPAGADEAADLGLETGAAVIRLHRLRLVDDVPVMRDEMVLDASRLRDFPTDPAQVPALFYLHLVERYGIRVAAVREEVGADLATPEDLRLLGLDAPSAILTIKEVAYDQAGLPVILARHRATTAHHRYLNEIR